jgi:hypothetical protein
MVPTGQHLVTKKLSLGKNHKGLIVGLNLTAFESLPELEFELGARFQFAVHCGFEKTEHAALRQGETPS